MLKVLLHCWGKIFWTGLFSSTSVTREMQYKNRFSETGLILRSMSKVSRQEARLRELGGILSPRLSSPDVLTVNLKADRGDQSPRCAR